MAFEGDLEGRLAAAPDLRDEAIVAGQAQQAPGAQGPLGACTSTWAALPLRTLSAGRGSLITREPPSSSGVEGMKTFLIAVLGAAVLVLPAGAVAKPDHADKRAAIKQCKAEQGKTKATRKAFKAKYHSFSRCVRQNAAEEHAEKQAALKNAAKQCKAERADPTSRPRTTARASTRSTAPRQVRLDQGARAEAGPEDQADAQEVQAFKNAAKECAAERSDPGFAAAHDGKSFEDSTGATATSATRLASASRASRRRTRTHSRSHNVTVQGRAVRGARRGAPSGASSSTLSRSVAVPARRRVARTAAPRRGCRRARPSRRRAERVEHGLLHDLGGRLEQLAHGDPVVAQQAQLQVVAGLAVQDPVRRREREGVLAAGVRPEAARRPARRSPSPPGGAALTLRERGVGAQHDHDRPTGRRRLRASSSMSTGPTSMCRSRRAP